MCPSVSKSVIVDPVEKLISSLVSIDDRMASAGSSCLVNDLFDRL